MPPNSSSLSLLRPSSSALQPCHTGGPFSRPSSREQAALSPYLRLRIQQLLPFYQDLCTFLRYRHHCRQMLLIDNFINVRCEITYSVRCAGSATGHWQAWEREPEREQIENNLNHVGKRPGIERKTYFIGGVVSALLDAHDCSILFRDTLFSQVAWLRNLLPYSSTLNASAPWPNEHDRRCLSFACARVRASLLSAGESPGNIPRPKTGSMEVIEAFNWITRVVPESELPIELRTSMSNELVRAGDQVAEGAVLGTLRLWSQGKQGIDSLMASRLSMSASRSSFARGQRQRQQVEDEDAPLET